VAARTALVTGGTGFIGRSLVDALVSSGYRVRAIGRRPVISWRGHEGIDHIRADIAQPGVLEAALKNIQVVFHLAAATSGDQDYYHRVTVEATERLLNRIAACGGRVVILSSASIYDGEAMADAGILDEDFPLERNPAARGLYAQAKTQSELCSHRYLNHPKVRLTIVRPGLVYGPRSRNVLNGAALTVRGKLLITTGTPSKLLPLIYIDDLTDALVLIAKDDRAIGRIYNFAHRKMPSVRQFLQAYRELSRDWRPMFDVPLPKLIPLFSALDKLSGLLGRNSNYVYSVRRLASAATLSSERIRRELGIEARIGFREGLEKIFHN